ncbi:hypothetical protein [Streptomyces fagopyri]
MSWLKFDPEAVARRIGPAAVEEADRSVAAAPPFSEEIRAKYRALFAAVRFAEPKPSPERTEREQQLDPGRKGLPNTRPSPYPPAPRRPIRPKGNVMTESFEALEDRYRAALNRVTGARRVLQEIMGDPKPIGPGEEPPFLTKAHIDAQTEAIKAFQDLAPVRDLYWTTRWGREGNSPKS